MKKLNVIKFPKLFKPKTYDLASSPVAEKSCGNCAHYRRGIIAAMESDKCLHYPTASLLDVNNQICGVKERPLWSKKKGLLTRFVNWLL